MGRRRVFISHAFASVGQYAALLDRLSAHNYDVYNHSIPFWNPVDACGQELAAAIERKMRGCHVVLVLVTPGIHNSAWIEYEMRLAQAFGKRVIGVWPHGDKGQPIPQLLDQQLSRMVGWNGPALIKAIEGEHPADTRVFDIAEIEDKKRIVRYLVSGASIGVLVLIGTRDLWMQWLNRALKPKGISLRLEEVPDGPGVVGPALIGSAVGLVAAAFTGKPRENMAPMMLVGGAIGAGVGVVASYRLHVLRSSGAQVIDVAFEPEE